MGHTMRNLAEMGLLKNRSAFICRPTPEEALKWGDSLDKLLAHKCKFLLQSLTSSFLVLVCFAFNSAQVVQVCVGILQGTVYLDLGAT